MENNLTNESFLQNIISNIKDVNYYAMKDAKKRLDSLAKPLGSLGMLEDLCIKLAGITEKLQNKINKKAVIIMCADNGVVEEGIASGPQSLTLAQTINFTKGLTGVAVLAKQNNTDLIIVDVGINSDKIIENVINRKINKGTNNILKGQAMHRHECIAALNVGIEMSKKAKDQNYSIIGVGEMGIGNTTTSSAVLKALTNNSVHDITGKGAGLTDSAFQKKKWVIEEALKINSPDKNDAIDILAKVGGYDIAAMTGVFLGCAYYKLPIVIDGFISAVAALCACKLNPLVKKYLIASHFSKEIGYNIAIKHLGLEPMLNLKMRLGEGSGCPIAFSIIESACAIINNMATFEQAQINTGYLDAVRDEKCYIV
ncbi:nicotinate-nucleotide--dimethylbenzimidazole phosphoribosyltransferase [Clostridium tarantellae]|uniref:Nicotinate-nucleotide--dimethylbenzimidazole phosphoribosyltransferase n=1 Tax=Clostridium tarantellae TaxID=39493 RepID=A0A6I1MPB0_9CLOT|nr:nicotinate-nucleotide--dimethylbenzimidazole phosphoribosyltransferase [Clostridium tarantellae]MPQ44062.1 nicotinate-nucleotide--dimethylbenzimidazole phosphoribosyltransferase [Clostridium tarantellae]